MPAVQILFYRDPGEDPPVLEWLECLPEAQKARAYAGIRHLEREGHELRRPHADLLRDRIYELRVTHLNLQNRILYFFDGQGLVILAHGLKKEARVPDRAIELALSRRERFTADPAGHSAEVVLQ